MSEQDAMPLSADAQALIAAIDRNTAAVTAAQSYYIELLDLVLGWERDSAPEPGAR